MPPTQTPETSKDVPTYPFCPLICPAGPGSLTLPLEQVFLNTLWGGNHRIGRGIGRERKRRREKKSREVGRKRNISRIRRGPRSMKWHKGGGSCDRVQDTGWGEVSNPSTLKATTWVWVSDKWQHQQVRRSYLLGRVGHGVDVEPFLARGKEGGRLNHLVPILLTRLWYTIQTCSVMYPFLLR